MSDLQTLIGNVQDLQDDVTVIVERYDEVIALTENLILDASAEIDKAAEWAIHPEDTLIPAPNGNGIDEYSALHWAKKSETSEATAVTSAANAATSEANAATSEANAAASDASALTRSNAAAASATAAAISEANLGTAESNAAASAASAASDAASTAADRSEVAANTLQVASDRLTATNAATTASNQADISVTQAGLAATSAINAAASEASVAADAAAATTAAANAATSETNAATSETNAAASETNAATSATNAATSETNAATSATSAATSATAAATIETNLGNHEINAAASAAAAATSETNAATSATNAAGSEASVAADALAATTAATNAATSESNAATSETNAATSATNAATSATNAATSETNAATSATEADASAVAAALSEANLGLSETNAANSAAAAAGSATAAAGSATAAATSAGEAATSATNAATSESNAATSEGNAASSEGNAATSATAASGSATSAAGSATNAATSATNAATSETAAAGSATAAATSATNAATSESNAAQSATDAANAVTGVADGQTAFSWGDHAAAGYLTSFTETDPTVPSHVKSITTGDISDWSAAHGWGDHATAGYLTSFTETDPTVPSHVKSISTTDISNWDAAHSWGDHATEQYLKANTGGYGSTYSIPIVAGAQVYTGGAVTIEGSTGTISTPNHGTSANWSAAHGWGDHSAEGYLVKGSTVDPTVVGGSTKFESNGTIGGTYSATKHGLEVRAEQGNDAYMAFHVSNDYAVYFGMSAASNRLEYGGWSLGSTRYQLWSSQDFALSSVANGNTAHGWGNHATAGYANATGSNASGTWPIGVTGKAGSVTVNSSTSGTHYPLLWASGNTVYKSTNNTPTASGSGYLRAYAFQGNANVAGTGNASYHPSGIYSTGTNWLYGTIYTNNNSIQAGSGAVTCGSLTVNGINVLKATGNYGTIKVNDDRALTWAGYAIRDDWVLMSSGANDCGIYNDTDNEWMTRWYRNAQTELHYNGVKTFETTAGGVYVTGTLGCSSQYAYTAPNYGHGIFGVYSSTRYQHVWSMGTAYKTSADGTSYGNMYGLTWTHPNVGTGTNQSIASLSHQLQGRINGTLVWAMGTGIWTSGNVTAYSDRAVKTNLEIIPDALEKLHQINGYTYDRTDYEVDPTTGEMPETRQAGVVAQEVEKILPEVVSGNEGNKAVAYGNMVSLLIEALKEADKKIDVLTTKFEQLKEAVNV